MNETTLERLQDVFREVLALPGLNISPSNTARDIVGWDSLTHMRIIAEVEERFGITFSFEDVRGLRNIGDLVLLIDSKSMS